MTLSELQTSYKHDAEKLGNYQELTKTELADGYCDAEEAGNAALASSYFSALMLRYWYKIYQWKVDSASLRLEDTEFEWWLRDAIRIAFVYKAWRDPENKIYGDPNAVDKIINQICFSVRGREYQHFNKNKRKANVQAMSLDEALDEDGDYILGYSDSLVDEYEPDYSDELIKMLLLRNQVIEALIIDGIAHYDTFKDVKKSKTVEQIDTATGEAYEDTIKYHTMEFDPVKLVKHLNSIDQKFLTKFCTIHSVSPLVGEETFDKLKKLNNTKLYKVIKKTLIQVRDTPELASAIR